MPSSSRGLIGADDIAKVREATDLVALAEDITLVKKTGGSWMARCVFHDDRNPSLHLDPQLGLYYCFGCQEAGDTISFYMKVQGIGFVAAVEALAARAGVELRYEESEEARVGRLRRNSLYETVEKAARWYHSQLIESPDAREVRRYLKGRSIDSAVAGRFMIGWAPRQAPAITKAVGVTQESAMAAGVLSRGDARPVEPLRGRIIFPIHTSDGRMCALAGRVLPGEEGPKYVNFAETDIYKKRQILYGLHLAKKAIVAADEVVVCEGYFDVIGCHLSGVERAVATCGVALTEEHVTALSRFAKRIVMAFDADGAGQGAIENVLKWENTHRVQFLVARLPEGGDPGQLYEEGRGEELVQAVTTAQPLLGWRIDRLFAASDLLSPEGQVRAADAAMEMVLGHPDSRVASKYVDVVAERCKLDPGPLRQQLDAAVKARERRARPKSTAAPAPPPLPKAEMEAIRLAAREPDALEWFAPAIFSDPGLRRAFEALLESGSAADAVSATPERVGKLLFAIEDTSSNAEPALLRRLLVANAARRVVSDLRFATREPDASRWVAEQMTLLLGGDEDACGALLAWLVARDASDARPSEHPNPSTQDEPVPAGGGGALDPERADEWL